METINITAPLTPDDRVLTGILRTGERFNAYQMMREFPSRKWNNWGLCDKRNLTPQACLTGASIPIPWDEISLELVDKAIDQWSRRVAAVVRARGGHIEYLLD